MSKLSDVILRDAAANRPAAGVAGRLFYDTTNGKLQRDNGAAWEDCEPGAAGADAGSVTYAPMTAADWNGDADPGNVDDALDQLAARVDDLEGAGVHAAVTLGTDADALLGLTGQQLTLDSQNANTVLAGPSSGAAADPTFRALTISDLPNSYALVRRVANQTINYATDTALSFDTEDADTDNYTNPSGANPTRFTMPANGVYEFIVNVIWQNYSGGGRFLNLRVNGSAWHTLAYEPVAYNDHRESGAAVLKLNANDYVEVMVFQTAPANITVTCHCAAVRRWA